jgi:ATP-dependent helicase/nuclease subunit A
MNRLDKQLSLDQLKAVSLDRNIAVTAGAGSGKTRVLAARYIRILEQEQGITPANIVALTFSRKAAADMRSRIREYILDKASDKTMPVNEADRWSDLLRQLPNAPIGTIHSFTAGILREFPNEAGIDPAFSIADEGDQRFLARIAAVRCIRKMNPADKEYSHMKRIAGYYNRSNVIRLLANIVTKPAIMNTLGNPAALMPDRTFVWNRFIEEKLLSQQCLDAVKNLSVREPENKTESGLREVIVTEYPNFNSTDYRTRFNSFDKVLDKLFTRSSNPISLRFVHQMADPITKLQEQLHPITWLRHIFSDENEAEALELATSLHIAACHTAAELENLQRTSPILTFDDLEHLTQKLLMDSPQKKHAIYMLKKRYRFFMVDEFQDTNDTQWQIIKPLVSSPNLDLDPNRLFIVGDPKQSIYGFRGADVTVFANVREQIVTSNQTADKSGIPFESLTADQDGTAVEMEGDIRLVENYRSKQEILDFADLVCGQIMTGGFDYEIPYDELRGMREGNGAIGILSSSEDKELPVGLADTGTSFSIRQALFMTEHIQMLTERQDVNYGDIAVMFPRRQFLPMFETTLRFLQIPFTIYKGIGFWDRSEIRDCLAFIAWLSNHSDRLALYSLLRSPCFGLSDDGLFYLHTSWQTFPFENAQQDTDPSLSTQDIDIIHRACQILKYSAAETGYLPVHQQLESFLETTGAFCSYRAIDTTHRRTANLDKLLDLICQFESEGTGFIRGVNRWLQSKAEELVQENEEAPDLPDENAVKLMTVHASKGLEFPVVYLVDLEGKLRHQVHDQLLHDPKWGIGFRLPSRSNSEKSRETAGFKIIRHHLAQRDLAEKKRLLYVAITRACNQLYLVPNVGGPDGGDPPENSWMSWILNGLKLTSSEITEGKKQITLPNGKPFNYDIVSSIPQMGTKPAHVLTGDSVREFLSLPRRKVSDQLIHMPCKALQVPIFPVTELVEHIRSDRERSTEKLVVDTDQLSDIEAQGNGKLGRSIGTLYHEMMEYRAVPSGDHLREMVDAAMARFGLNSCLREHFLQRITRIVKNTVSWERLPKIQSSRHYLELPFSFKTGTVIIQGIIDNLFQAENEWHILDYKTDFWNRSTDLDSWLEKHTEHHRLQMRIYALAVRKILSPDQSSIPVILYFADPGREVVFRVDDSSLIDCESTIQDITKQLMAQNG